RRRRNGILNNELYAGRITYNRQRFLKDPETAKRVSRPNPEHEWVTKEVPALRIIEDDLWNRVQAMRQSVLVSMGQQAAEQETTSLRSAQMRALRWRHDNQQGRSLLLFDASREAHLRF